jgi:LacI family transcriptional regulator
VLQLAERPTAIFTGSDVMAAGALRALHEVGLRVPEDMALVSFDDLPLASILTPPLTTVHQPLNELGAAAADLLLDRLELPDDHTPTHKRLPTHLVVRQSSGAPTARRSVPTG